MALLPYTLRPSFIIRRKAIWSGLLGNSTFWKVIAVWVLGKGTLKKFFGKSPEPLGTYRVGSDSFLNVINATPLKRKERKRRGITKQVLVARAVSEVSAARPGKGIRVK